MTAPNLPAPARSTRRGNYVAIPPRLITDNTRDVRRMQLYLNDERAPWGWWKKGLNG